MCVQVWGKEENLKDLLSEVATGSLQDGQDGQSPGVYLFEDPICGMQVTNRHKNPRYNAHKHTAADGSTLSCNASAMS